MLRTRWLPTLLLTVSAWAVSAADVLAAADDSGGNKMFAPALDLGIWTLIVFLVLFFVLKKYAWGPMLEGLRAREKSIRDAVEEAKLAREENRQAEAKFKAELQKAYSEIPKIMEEARRDAQQLKEEMKTQTAAEIQAERQRLLREIGMAKDQALQALSQHSALLATLISAKVLGRSINEDDHRRLIDEALVELQASHGKGNLPVN